MGIQRHEIRGDTPLDIKHVNDNFTTLWYDVYGNSKYAQKIEKALNALTYTFEHQAVGVRNLFLKSTAIDGYISNTGTIVTPPDLNNMASDYIEVVPSTEYCFSVKTLSGVQPWSRCAWYDSSKNFISVFAYMIDNYDYSLVVTAPSNAAYARVSARHISNDIAKMKFEEGNVPTDWTSAPEEVYSGIVKINADGVNVGVSNSAINTQLAYNGLRVLNGTTEIAAFGEAGANVPSLACNDITGNVLNTLDSSVTLTVGSGYTYSTVSAALASLGKRKILGEGSTLSINIYSTISDSALASGFWKARKRSNT